MIADSQDGRVNVQCPRCGALSGQSCHTVRPGGITAIARYHPERGRNQNELLAGGYIKYTILDDDGRPLFLWRRRTQRRIVGDQQR